jgi:hypothetical protein
MKKKVTLSFDIKIYDKYKKYCEEKGYVLSKQVELFMKDQLKLEEG